MLSSQTANLQTNRSSKHISTAMFRPNPTTTCFHVMHSKSISQARRRLICLHDISFRLSLPTQISQRHATQHAEITRGAECLQTSADNCAFKAFSGGLSCSSDVQSRASISQAFCHALDEEPQTTWPKTGSQLSRRTLSRRTTKPQKITAGSSIR